MVKKFYIAPYYTVAINEETGSVVITSQSKHAKGRELSQFLNPCGYLRVKMNNKSIEIHRIVAKFFIGERPDGYVVNHKDGDKLNNSPSNLEYVTIAENIRHSVEHGMHICNDVTKMHTYKDGRCSDIVKYKHEWYQKNRERLIKKAKERYYKSKE